MPIRRDAFERGLDDLDERVCQFLEQHKDAAYSPKEIAEALGVDLSPFLAALSFELRLNRLATQDVILSKAAGGGTYYAARLVKQQKG